MFVFVFMFLFRVSYVGGSELNAAPNETSLPCQTGLTPHPSLASTNFALGGDAGPLANKDDVAGAILYV